VQPEEAPTEEKKLIEPKAFKLIPTPSDVDEELRAGKLISSRVEDTTQAILVYKNKAKSASSILRFGIETVDSLTNPIIGPILTAVDKNVVGKVDPLLSYAYTTAIKIGTDVYKIVDVDGDGIISANEAFNAPLNIFQGLVVDSEWFDKVDDILNPAKITPENLVARFNEASAEAFKKAYEAAKAARQEISIYTSDEFVAQVKHQMKEAWDEKLAGPAKEFLAQAKAEFKRIDTNGDGFISPQELLDALKPTWEEKVVKVFRARIRPAVIAYKSIFEAYAHYRKVADEKGLKVSAEEFINEVKSKLQGAYDERLAPLIKEFYEGASKILTEDLERIVAALDADGDNKLTLNDFVIMSKALLQKFVANPYKAALRTTLKTIDYILPEEKEADMKKVTDDLSLSLVTTNISKRLVRKAFSGLTDLKVRAEKLIGPDLIKYAEGLSKTCEDLAKDVHDKRLAPALNDLNEKVETFKTLLSEKVVPMQKAANDLMESARAQELKKRFALAVERSQGFAKDGIDYLFTRDLFLLPSDLGSFFAITIGIKEKGEEYDKVVSMVSELLFSILDVIKIVNWKEEKIEAEGSEEQAKGEEKSKTDEDGADK